MTPIRFVYFDEQLGEKAYVSIFGQFKHYFTGETMYHTRIEEANGWVMEPIISETEMKEILKHRVEE